MALYTFILSPTPSLRLSSTLTLCTLALFTVEPSISTGSNTATGFILPVLDVFHSMAVRVVSASSSLHLKAMESLGNLDVMPSDSL